MRGMKMAMRQEIDALLTEQRGLIARWQLHQRGCSDAQIEWLRGTWRDVHAGVYVSGHAPLTSWQRHFAATLTEPRTVLARWSAAALHGLREDAPEDPIHVIREGTGGHRRYRRGDERLDDLDLRYSTVLAGDVEAVDGILVTTLPRTILDLCRFLSAAQRDRLFRDSIRLRLTTRDELQAIADKHRGRRDVWRLRALLAQYSKIPIERTRSDPEIEGLVALDAAGLPMPAVNIDINGFEADFVDVERRRILELDGPSTHQFPERDAERTRAWEAAGFTVERRPTDDAYYHRQRIVDGMLGE